MMILSRKEPRTNTCTGERSIAKIFWNMNFGFFLAMIDRITSSLGSKALIGISDSVCERMKTPASFVVRQEMAMRYQHNIRMGELYKKDLCQYSPITRNALFFFINQFCRYNRIDALDRQRLKKLGMNIERIALLPQKK